MFIKHMTGNLNSNDIVLSIVVDANRLFDMFFFSGAKRRVAVEYFHVNT